MNKYYQKKVVTHQEIKMAKNLLALVDEFKKNERMTKRQIEEALTMCDARRYIYRLREKKIIYICKLSHPIPGNSTPAVYRITDDLKAIEEFLENTKKIANHQYDPVPVVNDSSLPKEYIRKKKRPAKEVEAGRLVHSLEDDQPLFLRKSNFVVHRHWLDVALFGDGPAPSLKERTC